MIASQSFSESRFWKHIGVIMLVKLVAIFSLWFICFSPRHQVTPDAALMQQQLTESAHYD